MKKQLLLFVTMLMAVVMPMKLWAADGNAEPYAVLSDNNTKLTFFYDDQKEARGGLSVGPFSGFKNQSWFDQRESITTAVFDESFANCTTLTATDYWFFECKNMVSISGIEYLKTDNVTDMYRMFSGCSALTSLDVSGFNTANVTDMSWMFSGCSALTSLDVSGFNTANVTSMSGMFYGCSGLTSLDVSGFNTANVTNMESMFDGCSGLTNLDVTNFNTANVTDMYGMFFGCSGLTSLDVSGFNTVNVTSMEFMFSHCSSLTSLDVSNFKTDNVTDMRFMFYGCSSLTSHDVSNFNTANVTSMSDMFSGCSGLKTIYSGSGWTTNAVTDGNDMFSLCTSLVGGAGTPYDANHIDYTYAHIDGGENNPGYFTDVNEKPEAYVVPSGDDTGVSTLTFYYDNQKESRSGWMPMGQDGSDITWANYSQSVVEVIFDDSFANCTTITSTSKWFNEFLGLKTVTGLSNLKTDHVTDMSSMFNNCWALTNLDLSSLNTVNVADMSFMVLNCYNLTDLNVSGFNTSNVTNMSHMFAACPQLTNLDVSGFNTEKVTNMDSMFEGCAGLTSLDVSGFNTANVTNMSHMFSECLGLTGLDVSGFNTANVTNMRYLFSGCTSLTSLDVSGFNTANVTRMEAMFNGCSSLMTLNVGSFNTTNVTEMGHVFGNCSLLTSLDLSNFNTSNVTRIQGMFDKDSLLTSIYVGSEWSIENVTEGNNVFRDCISLVGGAGTVYDANHTDYTYAHIDGGTSNPGYFTDKNAAPYVNPEPYAVLSDNNTVLTFYYDDQKAARGGMSVAGSFGYYEDVPWYSQRESITSAEFDPSFANCTTLTSTTNWFNGCWNMVSISGIQYLKTDNVTDMSSMFERCFNLTSLDLSNFNTENVTDMHSMFDSCSRLASLNVSSFNTNKVTNMGLMFSACYELTSLDVSGFNTDNVTDMHGMFGGSSGLTSLDLSNFKTDKVTTMFLMFEGCLGLPSLDLSSFNTENVTKFSNMFKDCSNLKTIYVGNDWSTANVAEGTSMFYGCTNLVGGAGTVFDDNHVDHTYAHIDGGSSNPGYFTAKNAPEGEATFDGKVARVSGERTLDEAFEQRGGRAEATRTIAAIIWNKESALTESDLQGITNPNLLVYVNEARLAPSNVQNVVINGLAREIVLTDAQDGNNDWYAPQAFVAERISYTRNFGQSTTKGTSRGWESIALPFDVQTIQHESKGVIAPFNNSASNKHFWLRRLTDNGLQAATNIEANTPYIISMPNSEEYTSDYNLNGRVTFSAQNIDVPATTTKVLALADSSIVMVPVMQRQSDYRTVRPFEAYTIHRQENGQPAPRYVPIQEIAGVTGIETIDREPLTLNQWYDMQGRKLEGKPARKGVYISNGKKVVVK